MNNNKLSIGVLLGLLTLILFILKFPVNSNYLSPFLISVFNTVFVFWFLAKGYYKNIIIYLYFIYNLVILKLPLIYILLRYNSAEVDAYYKLKLITQDDLILSNTCIFIFDLLLITFLIIFKKLKIFTRPKPLAVNKVVLKTNKSLLIILFIIISYLAKLYLIYTGIWFFYEMNNIDISEFRFAGIANILEKFDFLVLLYFAYKYKIGNFNKKNLTAFIVIISISLIFAFISTSKGKILTLLFPLIIIMYYSKHRIKYAFIFVISAFFVSAFFDFMMYYRVYANQNYTFEEIVNNYSMEKKQEERSYLKIRTNKILYRLEYQTVIAQVLKVYSNQDSFEKIGFEQNLIGLIPRFIWPSKPSMGINTNRIGYELGILHSSDNYTTIGITPIGVAFYFYGYIGVFYIALFTSFLLVFCIRKTSDNSWISFLLSIVIGIQLARDGTYLTIIPSLIQIFIVFSIFGMLLNRKEFIAQGEKFISD